MAKMGFLKLDVLSPRLRTGRWRSPEMDFEQRQICT